MIPPTLLLVALAGACTWTLGEYLLHRFAMHELHGRGILSREHLEHHVRASWTWDPIMWLAWTGVVLTGLGWAVVAGLLTGAPAVGAAFGGGWILGYFFYEYVHAQSHLRGPTGRYSAFVRRHHFHHHFGHPMANHGVTTGVWDRVFGTYERPERVRVPRRLAMEWLVDEHGEVRPEFADEYELVGADILDERQAQIDRAKAFASVAPDP